MPQMWMIRGEGGSLYDEFRSRSVAALGWSELAKKAAPGMTRKQLIDAFRSMEPTLKQGTIVSGASQVWRFINEIQLGDGAVTYSPANRTYLVGRVTGPYLYRPDWADLGMAQTRAVQWQTKEVDRDNLSAASRNSLGSTLTVFQLPDFAARELLGGTQGTAATILPPEDVQDEIVIDPLADVENTARERIKDLISRLGWEDAQELIAGLLRAMGYKTQVSPAGSDRGKDIIASPDGFGFSSPRIVVEVKHRKGQMDSAAIRSFLGGRHKDDRGLYVSTGGFTKDALYEADRASIPLTLWTLDNVVRALVDNYESTDSETKRLIPLKRVYVPA